MHGQSDTCYVALIAFTHTHNFIHQSMADTKYVLKQIYIQTKNK